MPSPADLPLPFFKKRRTVSPSTLADVVHGRGWTNHHRRRRRRCDNCRWRLGDDSHFRRWRRNGNIDVVHWCCCNANCRLLDRDCCGLSYGNLLRNNNKRGCDDRHADEVRRKNRSRKKGKLTNQLDLREMRPNGALLRNRRTSPSNLASR